MNTPGSHKDKTLAMVFPGQGSQSVGMLSELAKDHAQVGDTFQQASEVLGYDLWQLVREGPVEALNRTDRTQPAMLAAGVSVWRVWQAHNGANPALMAGHSLGEYTALVCAGALEFPDAIALVAERGRLMQNAVVEGSGAMAAIIGLDDEAVRGLCAEAANNEVVSAANFNSPGQVVIAGQADAVQRAITLAKDRGAKRAIPLPVSVPSHCELMVPAAEQFAARLEQTAVTAPQIPVIQNADVQAHNSADGIRETLRKQLYCPVLWVGTVEYMAGTGIERIIEAGPGKVLAGLCRRINKKMTITPVYDSQTLEDALNA